MPLNPLRQKLKSNQGTLGLWATMECASITEIAVALNMDWVVVDMEHGHLDYKDAMDHIRVVRETGTSIIIRVSDIREDCVKRALDMGAHGVILPLPRSAARCRGVTAPKRVVARTLAPATISVLARSSWP